GPGRFIGDSAGARRHDDSHRFTAQATAARCPAPASGSALAEAPPVRTSAETIPGRSQGSRTASDVRRARGFLQGGRNAAGTTCGRCPATCGDAAPGTRTARADAGAKPRASDGGGGRAGPERVVRMPILTAFSHPEPLPVFTIVGVAISG